MKIRKGIVILVSVLSVNTASVISADVVNDFEDGTNMDWHRGINSKQQHLFNIND